MGIGITMKRTWKEMLPALAIAFGIGVAFWVAGLFIANLFENYAEYIGIFPIGVWIYPLAWLAPFVRLLGQVAAVLSTLVIILVAALRHRN